MRNWASGKAASVASPMSSEAMPKSHSAADASLRAVRPARRRKAGSRRRRAAAVGMVSTSASPQTSSRTAVFSMSYDTRRMRCVFQDLSWQADEGFLETRGRTLG